MRKKIIAGVAAMLMVASCVPANTNFGFSLTAPITASAANDKLELENVTLTKTKDGDIEITPINLFALMGVDDSVSTLDINMSKLKADITNFAGGSLSGKKVILKQPKTSLKNDVNLSHINFTDDIITDVGASFVSGCKTLQTVNFGSKINTIGNSAFNSCDHLQGTFGNTLDLSNIETIGDSAFSSAVELINIKFSDNLTSIGSSAFSSDAAIKNLNFPAALLSIGNSAFYGCKGLETVKFQGNDTLSSIGTSAFANCTSLTAVNVTGFNYNKLPNGSPSIESGARIFSGCTSLQNFTWSSSFTLIPESTFSGCSALTKFNFEGGAQGSSCVNIERSAFSGCKSLTSIDLPNANINIGDQAFYDCNKLQEVVVSDKLTNVGYQILKKSRTRSFYHPHGHLSPAVLLVTAMVLHRSISHLLLTSEKVLSIHVILCRI